MKKTVLALLCSMALCGLAEASSGSVTLTCSNYTGTETLENFPMLVRLSEESIPGFSYEGLDASLILFKDASGNELPCDVDTWNPDGESLVWVKVPSLAATTAVTLHWGKQRTTASAAVWSAYDGVWHFNEQSGTTFADSKGTYGAASVAVPGTETHVSCTIGAQKLGNGVALVNDGEKREGNMLTTESLTLSGAITVSGWYQVTKLRDSTSDTYPNLIRGGAWQGGGFYLQCGTTGDSKVFTLVANSNQVNYNQNPETVLGGGLHHVAVTVGSDGSKLYIDGIQKCSSASARLSSWTGKFNLLASVRSAAADEVRVQPTVASPDWIAADYQQQASADGVLYAVGAEPPTPGPKTNSWTTLPSIQPTTWAVGETPGTIAYGVAESGGEVKCSHTQTQVDAFEVGSHTVTFTVDATDEWTALSKSITVTVNESPTPVVDKNGWVNPDGGDWATSSNWGNALVPGVDTDFAFFNASTEGYGSIWPITVNNAADRTLKWLSAAQNANVTIDFDGNTLTANSSTSSSIGSPTENINGGDCLVVSNSTVTLRNGTYNFKTFEMVGPSGSRPELIADGSGTAVKFYGKPDKNLSTALNLATYGGDSAATFHRFITARNGAKIIFDAGASASTMAHLAGGNWTSSAPMNRNEFHMTVDGEGSLIRFGELSGQGNAPNFITVLNNGILEADRKLQAYQQQIDLTLDTKGQLKVGTDPNGKSDGMHLGLQSKIYIGDGMITAPFLWANADVCSKSTINITVPETGYTKDWLPIKTVGGSTDRTQLKNLTFRIDVSKWSELAELQRTNPADHNTRVFPIVTSTQVLCDSSKTDPLLENDECLTRTQFPNLPVDISAKLVLADDGHTVNVQLTKVSPDFPDPPTPPVDPSDNEATYTWAQSLLLGWWHANNWQSTGVDPQFPNSPNATARYVAPSAGVSSYWTKANGNVALFNLKFDASAPTIIDIAGHTLNASIDPAETTEVSANTDTSKTGGTLTDTSMDTRGHILGLYKSKVTLMGESGTYNFNGLELVTDAEAAYSELVITNTTVNMRGVKCSGSPYSGLYTAMQIPLNGAGNASPQSTKDHNWIRVQAGGKLILDTNTMLCMNRAQALNLEADGGEITLPYGVAHVNNPQAYIVRAKNGGKISGFSSGYQVGYASATSTDQAQMMLEADNGEINIGGTLKLSGKNQYGEASVRIAGKDGKISAGSLELNTDAVANYSTLQFDLPVSGWTVAPMQINGSASGAGQATVRVNFEGYNGVPKEIPLIETTSPFSLSSYTLATEGQIPEGLTAELVMIDSGKTLAISIHQIRTVVTVSFDAQNGGTNPDPIDVVQGEVYGELPTPTYSGHTFMGWFTEATGGTPVTDDTVVTADAAHTLYAHWQRKPGLILFFGPAPAQ